MKIQKNIIITGINGQLGQFLAKYLQEREPEVQIIGTIRHKSYDNQPYIFDKTKAIIELMDLSDVHSIENLIIKYKPNFFVNTAANAFVGESWAVPVQHIEQNTIGVLHQLEAIRKHSPLTRYFNMGTSEEFGCRENNGLQDESTIISPKSPYGCSKAAARYLISVYRKSYGLYAVQNWTFNFESELRGEKYVTKKVTMGVVKIHNEIRSGKQPNPIEIGNLDSHRSWQFCGDVADSIWKCLNQEKYNKSFKAFDSLCSEQSLKQLSTLIKEYVVSAPETHSIRELIETSFSNVGIEGNWHGSGVNEKFISKDNITLVIVNPKFLRPVDVTFLNGDAKSIQNDLGWKPTLSFKDLIQRMVSWDLTN
jgi:GDPmannose 4,6-dehydratase